MEKEIFTKPERDLLELETIPLSEYIDMDYLFNVINDMSQGELNRVLNFDDIDENKVIDLIDAFREPNTDELPIIDSFVGQGLQFSLNDYFSSLLKEFTPSQPVHIYRNGDMWIKVELVWLEAKPRTNEMESLSKIGYSVIKNHLSNLLKIDGPGHLILEKESQKISKYSELNKEIQNQNNETLRIDEPEYDFELGDLTYWSFWGLDKVTDQLFFKYLREQLRNQNYKNLIFKIEVYGYSFGNDILIPDQYGGNDADDWEHLESYESTKHLMTTVNTDDLFDLVPAEIKRDRFSEPYSEEVTFQLPSFLFNFKNLIQTLEYPKNPIELIDNVSHYIEPFNAYYYGPQPQLNLVNSRYQSLTGKVCQLRLIEETVISSKNIKLYLDRWSVELRSDQEDIIVDDHYLEWKKETISAVQQLDYNRVLFPLITNPNWVSNLNSSISVFESYLGELREIKDAVESYIQSDTAIQPTLIQIIREQKSGWVTQSQLRSQYIQRRIDLGDLRVPKSIERSLGRVITSSIKNIQTLPEIESVRIDSNSRGPHQFKFRHKISKNLTFE